MAPARLSPNASRAPTRTAPAATAATNKVALRALIVAVDGDDFGLATWKTTLDRVGAAYDVLLSRTHAADRRTAWCAPTAPAATTRSC